MGSNADGATAARTSRNISLIGELGREIFADPSILNDMLDDATLYLIPEDDPEFAEMVKQTAERARRDGQRAFAHHLSRTPGSGGGA